MYRLVLRVLPSTILRNCDFLHFDRLASICCANGQLKFQFLIFHGGRFKHFKQNARAHNHNTCLHCHSMVIKTHLFKQICAQAPKVPQLLLVNLSNNQPVELKAKKYKFAPEHCFESWHHESKAGSSREGTNGGPDCHSGSTS